MSCIGHPGSAGTGGRPDPALQWAATGRVALGRRTLRGRWEVVSKAGSRICWPIWPACSPSTWGTTACSHNVPFLAVALSEYLRIARTLAGRIVTETGEPIAMPVAESDQLDDTELHAALARWGINAAVWPAQFQQLDR